MTELDPQVAEALGAIGESPDSPAHDGWLDPALLAAALAGPEPVLLRAHRRLEAGDEGFGDIPADPVWLVLGDAGAGRATPLRGSGGGEASAETCTFTAARLEITEEPWPPHAWGDGPTAAALWLEGDGEPLLVAEWLGEDEAAARAAAEPLRAALAQRLGTEPAAETATADGAPLPARSLARWSLRREGGVVVLRDHGRLGPREGAEREALLTVTLGAIALVAAAIATLAYGAQQWERVAVAAVVAVVSLVATFTFAQVALHSYRYRARSEALLVLAHGGFVVAPWLGRDGSVRTDPEGRFGAALRLRELAALHVLDADDGFTLRIDTDHGPYDVGTTGDEAAAEAWRLALLRHADAGQPDQAPAARGHRFGAVAAALLLGTLLGCTGEQVEVVTPPTAPPEQAAEPPPLDAPTLNIVEDDIEGAMRIAAAEDKPVFVEVWAPWCHTCLSMKQFVLPDPGVAALGDRVVFAALDSDRPKNAAFVERYTVDVWPTLYVLTPDGEVLGRWLGAASVDELRRFIEGAADLHASKRAPEGPVAKLVEGHRHQAAGEYDEAARAFDAALRLAPDDWPRRSEALYGRMHAHYRGAAWADCVAAGRPHLDAVEGSALPTDFSWVLLRCAEEADEATLRAVQSEVRERMKRHVEHPPDDASIDDRADALGLFATVLDALGEPTLARQQRERSALLLEGAAAAAPGPREAATFDYARMKLYLAQGRGQDAIALLQRRRSQLPDDYEPHARLGETFLALERPADALEPLERALALAYGPRRLRYLDMQARAHHALKHPAEERAALEELLKAHAELKPELEARWQELADSAQERLDALTES